VDEFIACTGDDHPGDDAPVVPRREFNIYLEQSLSTADPLYAALPVVPILPADTRTLYSGDGGGVQDGSVPDPTEWGRSVVAHMRWWFATIGAGWPSSRPKRFAFKVNGIDWPDFGLYILRHPSDITPNAVDGSVRHAMPYNNNGTTVTAPWMATAMQAVYGEMTTAEKAGWLALFDNSLEYFFGDPPGSFTRGDGSGWSEQMRDDPRYDTLLFDGVQTVKAFVDAQSIDRNGNERLPYNGALLDNVYSPVNLESMEGVYLAAYERGVFAALNRNVFAAALAVKPGLICGEWGYPGDGTRSVPVSWYPRTPMYMNGGYIGGNARVPDMYHKPGLYRYLGDDPVRDADSNQHPTLGNYSSLFPPPSGYNAEQKKLWLLRAFGVPMLRQFLQSTPQHAVVPSYSTTNGVDPAELDFFEPIITELIVQTAGIGCSGVWMFEPSYETENARTLRVCEAALTRLGLV
jgi:hypothetical protein